MTNHYLCYTCTFTTEIFTFIVFFLSLFCFSLFVLFFPNYTLRSPFSISQNVNLVVVNFSSFACLGNPLSLLQFWMITLLNREFYSVFASALWICLAYLPMSLLPCKVSIETSVDTFIRFSVYVTSYFSLVAFIILFYCFNYNVCRCVSLDSAYLEHMGFLDLVIYFLPHTRKFYSHF